jgi:hypothetical protein
MERVVRGEPMPLRHVVRHLDRRGDLLLVTLRPRRNLDQLGRALAGEPGPDRGGGGARQHGGKAAAAALKLTTGKRANEAVDTYLRSKGYAQRTKFVGQGLRE